VYKLLAVDLDGTLVRRDGIVDPRDRSAIDALRARGVQVAISTGRLYAGSRHVAAELGLDGVHVFGDGASIVEFPSDRELRHVGIVDDASTSLHTALGRHDALAVCALVDQEVVIDERGAPFENWVKGWTPNLTRVDSVLSHACWRSERGPMSAVAVGLSEQIADVVEELGAADELQLFHFDVKQAAGVSALIVHAQGVSKGAGVTFLAEHYGCTLEEVVAIGDWHNDVSMLRCVGRSFAMGHALDEVKQAASDVLEADGQSGGGVAEAIARAWP
jgi:Cof subfamily protein (haloacid dehalogenase superfamily)